MKNLLAKDFRLALHPAALLFLGLSAMMLIPNYPLTVTFFYPCLGVFFICLSSRENRDLFYTMLLPVEKRLLPRARIAMAAILQLGQVLLCLPFCLLRTLYPPEGNVVGLDANLALLGFGLVEMGLFNLIFFPWHYRNPAKVGAPFLAGCAGVFFWVLLSEALPHFVPLVRDRLDTPPFVCLPEKLCCFCLGLLAFLGLTLSAARRSEKRFEVYDLT